MYIRRNLNHVFNLFHNFFPQLLFYWFRFVGLAPFSMTTMSDFFKLKMSIFGCCYNIFLIAFIFVMNLQSFSLLQIMPYPTDSTYGQTSRNVVVVKGGMVLLAVWLIICVRQRKLIKAINDLIEEDKQMQQFEECVDIQNCGGPICFLIFFNILLWIYLIGFDIFSYDSKIIFLWFSMMTPNFVFNWFLVQYTITLIFIEQRFRSLNRCILKLGNISEFNNLNGKLPVIKRSSIKMLFTIEKYHLRLYEITTKICDFYGMPLFFIIHFLGGMLIGDIYFYLFPVLIDFKDRSVWLIINSVFRVMLHSAQLSILIVHTVRIENEVISTVNYYLM